MLNICTSKEYWFIVEPHVYISFKNDSIFLYNTLDGVYVESENSEILFICKPLVDEQKSVILIQGSLLIKKDVSNFISILRKNFMADIIEASLVSNIPLQFTPMLNLQNSVDRLKSDKNRSVGENLLNHLHEVSIFLEDISNFTNKYYPISGYDFQTKNTDFTTFLDFNLIKLFLSQLLLRKELTVNIIIKNPSEYNQWRNLLSYLKTLPFRTKYIFSIDYLDPRRDLKLSVGEKAKINYTIDFSKPNEIIKLSMLKNYLTDSQTEYSFLVYKEEDIVQVENFVNENNNLKYQIVPIYDNKNIDFFEENVFLTRDDILEHPISTRQIFINQTINIESFGKLSITPSGDIFANIFDKKIGNIVLNSILEVIYSEMNHSTSWFNIRDKYPCKKCHFQWLCPTPSAFEIILKRINLCHINIM